MLSLRGLSKGILNHHRCPSSNLGALRRRCLLLRPVSSAAKDGPEIEDIYQRKTPLEHVLLRPGMYVGAVEPTRSIEWVYDMDSGKMVKKQVEYIPALLKIFDEILVNAADNKQRCGRTRRIEVTVEEGDPATGRPPRISIQNDGGGVPVRLHRNEQVYVPELVFGHLLTGSNFDDAAGGRLTGGRHGYGAKLTNIFSQEFTVATVDAARGLRYRQAWRANMAEKGPPEVSPAGPGAEDHTRVTFVPDLARLGVVPSAAAAAPAQGQAQGQARAVVRLLGEDHLALMLKRAVDVAGCVGPAVEVRFNGARLPRASFREYMGLYTTGESSSLLCAQVNKRWEVGVEASDSGQFEQVSFVNAMATTRGGSHVNLVVSQLVGRLQEHIARKYPDLNVTGAQIKNNMFVFVNALIENPTFDSQMKETLTSKPNTFGSTCILSEAFFKRILNETDIVDQVVSFEKIRQQASLQKKALGKRSSSLNIPKLEDAHYAGTAKAHECTLILTEGDSAKALAVAGLEVIGREHFGVFPLKGKLLNVREATVAQLSENAEVLALCNILGLNFDETYEDGIEGKLRYGRVMVMTDQDHDGSHIKGLVLNFFHHFWPRLLERGGDGGGGGDNSEGGGAQLVGVADEQGKQQEAVFASKNEAFLQTFITPLLKARRGKEVIPFYSSPEFEAWKRAVAADPSSKNWKIKYYKGLGTSTAAEAKEYFRDLEKHLKTFLPATKEDGRAVEKAFAKAKVEARKRWLLAYRPEGFNSTEEKSLSVKDFVNNELIHFSHADNIRSIPSVVDGLKPSQRKVLHACLQRRLRSETKVAQLAGHVAERTAYHHGEASLTATIVAMAQDFVGANNLPLLVAAGQFGTRAQGGKDAASPRYVYTHLSGVARKLFPESDDQLLRYLEDEGLVVEPAFFAPVLPLLLVNGAQGIGTGWSTYIPPHHPLDIIEKLQSRLLSSSSEEDSIKLQPWFNRFKGKIELSKTGFTTSGRIERQGSTKVVISELPVGKWTSDYKEFLGKLMKEKKISSFTEHHTVEDVKFVVTMKSQALKAMDEDKLIQFFRLMANHSMSNMHAFDADGNIKLFASAEDIFDEHFGVRLHLYELRKKAEVMNLGYEHAVSKNRSRFITDVCSGEVDLLSGRPRAELVGTLEAKGFQPATELEKMKMSLADKNEEEEEKEEGRSEGHQQNESQQFPQEVSHRDFEYLLNMPMSNFTQEKILALKKDEEGLAEKLNVLSSKSASDLWLEDLEELKKEIIKSGLN